MATKEELYQEYEEALGKIEGEYRITKDLIKTKLRAGLEALREGHHEELKAIRHISQQVREVTK